MYKDLPGHLPKIFEVKPIKVADLADLSIERLLMETFTATAIQTEKKQSDGGPLQVFQKYKTYKNYIL